MATVLIIEDNEVVRMTLRMMMEDEGHSVCEAEDGASGIQAFNAAPCPIVITDLRMPNMDGNSVIEALRQHELPPRIIAVSGGEAGEDDRKFGEAARNSGADQVLRKPVRLEDLLNAVKSLL